MIKIENGECEIIGSIGTIKEDFRIFLKSMKYLNNTDLLNSFVNVLKEELEECKEQS